MITNAIKYAQVNLAPIITVKTQKNNDIPQLVFTDNGRGLDIDKVKDKIFGLNQKFHNHIDSHGIGLYLVYNHVVDMGGQIEVESQINKGTTFIITLRK